MQYFFVNGRNMRHPYFHKAVMSCYQDLISSDVQPNYFINFTVDPDTIDVNIHPQKHEIKFENEQPVWQILCATVKESLGRYNAVAAIDFTAVDAPDLPAFDPTAAASVEAPKVDFDPSYNPFSSSPEAIPSSATATSAPSPRSYERHQQAVTSNWEKLYDGFTSEAPAKQLSLDMEADNTVTQSVLQVKSRYIITPSPDGLLIIDQYRAHVRILYEKYAELVEQGQMTSQRLIFPEAITLGPCRTW